jgi:hypothetical protein
MRFYASFETAQRELQLKLTEMIRQDSQIKRDLG